MAPKRNEALCPECGKSTCIKPKADMLKNSIQRTYIQCGHCRHKETVYYTDKKIRKLLIEQRNFVNNSNLSMSAQEKTAKIAENKAVIDSLMAGLRDRIEGDADDRAGKVI